MSHNVSIIVDSTLYRKQGFISPYGNSSSSTVSCFRKKLHITNSPLTLFRDDEYDAYIYVFSAKMKNSK